MIWVLIQLWTVHLSFGANSPNQANSAKAVVKNSSGEAPQPANQPANESAPEKSQAPQNSQPTEADPFNPTNDITLLLKLIPRDPFKPPVFVVENQDTRPPLERYDKTLFKLIGIMTGPHRIRALIEAPDKLSYFAGLKTKIGTNGGYIKKIATDYVEIVETLTNEIGQKEELDFKLKLENEKIEQETVTADMAIRRAGGRPGASAGQNIPEALQNIQKLQEAGIILQNLSNQPLPPYPIDRNNPVQQGQNSQNNQDPVEVDN